MPRKRTRYYFGRFNVMAAEEDKDKLLSDGTKSHAILQKRGQHWQFLQVTRIDSSAGDFITGYLGKYRPETEEEVAIPEAQDIDDQTIENRITAKARFFLQTESHLISFHPVGSLITRKAFCSRFSEVFRLGFGNFFVDAEIQLIEEEDQILDALSMFSSTSRLTIYLHPSNPRNRDIWRRTDERLRDLRATEYREQYTAAGQSLKVTQDEDIKAKIAMAVDGYGWAEVTGIAQGEEKTVRTDDNPITASVPSDVEIPEEILDRLLSKFSQIMARFKE